MRQAVVNPCAKTGQDGEATTQRTTFQTGQDCKEKFEIKQYLARSLMIKIIGNVYPRLGVLTTSPEKIRWVYILSENSVATLPDSPVTENIPTKSLKHINCI